MKVEQYLKTVRKMSSRVIISLKHRPEGLQLNGEHIRTIDRHPCRGHPFSDHGGHPARLSGKRDPGAGPL